MPETELNEISGIPETLFITLYLRAMESRRPDALIKDEKAVELVNTLGYDFERVRSIPLSEENKLVIILRSRHIDQIARNFIALHPDATLVHIGCGLDVRFERVDNGQVTWYDLDFPHVIDIRRKLFGDEGSRHHPLGYSVLEYSWMDEVLAQSPGSVLFLAEGVFMYFTAEQVKALILKLFDHYPGSELAFDIYSPVHVWRHNLQTSASKISMRAQWGIWHGQQVERWRKDIHLLDEWGFFDEPEPRLQRVRWLKLMDAIFRTLRIYHFKLGV
jgi:O-methyltransferase involved in polyketide biosynthesis